MRLSQHHLLFESHPHPVWLYDPETLRFLMVNERPPRPAHPGIELLSKPFTPGGLTAKIREILDRDP